MGEQTPDGTTSEPRMIKCPRCGLVSEDMRCERCNAPKITQCSGSCSMCGYSTCVAPKKKEQGGL